MSGVALTYLNQQQLAQLHDASLRILENQGVRVEDPAMRDLLCQQGCQAREERVFFNRELIAAVVAGARNRISFCCGQTNQGFVLEPGRVRTHSTGGAPWVMDVQSGSRRNAGSSDMINALRLMNQLPELDLPCCLFYPEEVPAPISQYVQTETMFRTCKKPIYAPGVSTVGNAKYIAELFQVFAAGNQAYPGLVGVSPESPLYLPKEITDITAILAGAGIPIAILAAPMAGLTGPITVTGCVAQCHAEILAFAALAYLLRPETPLIFSYRPFFCNMKRAQAILGLPENGIASAICAQLAAYCGFLSDVYGLSCTAYGYDEQTGYEKMHNALLPALAGASLITGFGSLASVMCGSLEQLVLDNELFAMVRRSFAGFELDDESLGLEAIGNVAAGGSNYMVETHTLMHLRDPETFMARLGFDQMLSESAAAEKGLLDKAAEEVAALLAKDEPLSLPPETEAELKAIRKAAEQELL